MSRVILDILDEFITTDKKVASVESVEECKEQITSTLVEECKEQITSTLVEEKLIKDPNDSTSVSPVSKVEDIISGGIPVGRALYADVANDASSATNANSATYAYQLGDDNGFYTYNDVSSFINGTVNEANNALSLGGKVASDYATIEYVDQNINYIEDKVLGISANYATKDDLTEGIIVIPYADSATSADNATYANEAEVADFANNATHADISDNASNADSLGNIDASEYATVEYVNGISASFVDQISNTNDGLQGVINDYTSKIDSIVYGYGDVSVASADSATQATCIYNPDENVKASDNDEPTSPYYSPYNPYTPVENLTYEMLYKSIGVAHYAMSMADNVSEDFYEYKTGNNYHFIYLGKLENAITVTEKEDKENNTTVYTATIQSANHADNANMLNGLEASNYALVNDLDGCISKVDELITSSSEYASIISVDDLRNQIIELNEQIQKMADELKEQSTEIAFLKSINKLNSIEPLQTTFGDVKTTVESDNVVESENGLSLSDNKDIDVTAKIESSFLNVTAND